jgi:hypothetical protein
MGTEFSPSLQSSEKQKFDATVTNRTLTFLIHGLLYINDIVSQESDSSFFFVVIKNRNPYTLHQTCVFCLLEHPLKRGVLPTTCVGWPSVVLLQRNSIKGKSSSHSFLHSILGFCLIFGFLSCDPSFPQKPRCVLLWVIVFLGSTLAMTSDTESGAVSELSDTVSMDFSSPPSATYQESQNSRQTSESKKGLNPVKRKTRRVYESPSRPSNFSEMEMDNNDDFINQEVSRRLDMTGTDDIYNSTVYSGDSQFSPDSGHNSQKDSEMRNRLALARVLKTTHHHLTTTGECAHGDIATSCETCRRNGLYNSCAEGPLYRGTCPVAVLQEIEDMELEIESTISVTAHQLLHTLSEESLIDHLQYLCDNLWEHEIVFLRATGIEAVIARMRQHCYNERIVELCCEVLWRIGLSFDPDVHHALKSASDVVRLIIHQYGSHSVVVMHASALLDMLQKHSSDLDLVATPYTRMKDIQLREGATWDDNTLPRTVDFYDEIEVLPEMAISQLNGTGSEVGDEVSVEPGLDGLGDQTYVISASQFSVVSTKEGFICVDIPHMGGINIPQGLSEMSVKALSRVLNDGPLISRHQFCEFQVDWKPGPTVDTQILGIRDLTKKIVDNVLGHSRINHAHKKSFFLRELVRRGTTLENLSTVNHPGSRRVGAQVRGLHAMLLRLLDTEVDQDLLHTGPVHASVHQGDSVPINHVPPPEGASNFARDVGLSVHHVNSVSNNHILQPGVDQNPQPSTDINVDGAVLLSHDGLPGTGPNHVIDQDIDLSAFQVVSVAGDGACLYHSVGFLMAHENPARQRTSQELRLGVAQIIRTLSPAVVREMYERGSQYNVASVPVNASGNVILDLDVYADQTSRYGEFSGVDSVRVLGLHLRRTIVLYNEFNRIIYRSDIQELDSGILPTHPPLRLRFSTGVAVMNDGTVVANSNSGHFEPIVPIDTSQDGSDRLLHASSWHNFQRAWQHSDVDVQRRSGHASVAMSGNEYEISNGRLTAKQPRQGIRLRQVPAHFQDFVVSDILRPPALPIEQPSIINPRGVSGGSRNPTGNADESKRSTMASQIHSSYSKLGLPCSLDPTIRSLRPCADFLQASPPIGLDPLQLQYDWDNCKTKSQVPTVDSTTSLRVLSRTASSLGVSMTGLDFSLDTLSNKDILVKLIKNQGVEVIMHYNTNVKTLQQYVKRLIHIASVSKGVEKEGRDQARHSLILHGIDVVSSAGKVSSQYQIPSLGVDVDEREIQTDWCKITRHYGKICQLTRLGLWVTREFVDEYGVFLEDAADAAVTANLGRPFTSGQARQLLDNLPLGSDITCGGKFSFTAVQEQAIRAKQEQHAAKHYLGWESWQQTLRMELCGYCNLIAIQDSSMRDPPIQKLTRPFFINRQDGVRRCEECARCLIPDKWGPQNNMQPDPIIPPELACLTHVEGQLIARCIPMMKIECLRKGGRALRGNAISFHSPVSELFTRLPLLPSEVRQVYVVRGLTSDEDKQDVQDSCKRFRIRRWPVFYALQWLQVNNPAYKDIIIDPVRVNSLPVDGTVFGGFESIICRQNGCRSGAPADTCPCQMMPASPDIPSQPLPTCGVCGQGVDLCSCFLAPIVAGNEGDHTGGHDDGITNLGPAYQQLPPNTTADGSNFVEDISFWGDYDGGGDSADPVVRNSYALCLQTGGLPLFPDQSAEGNLNNGQLPNDSEGSGSGNGCGDGSGTNVNNGTRQHPLNLQMGQEDKVSETSAFFWTSCYPVLFPTG